MARLVVTGGAGYVGAVTARALVAAGHDVVVIDNLRTGFREAAPAPLVVADVRDRDTVAGVLRGADAVLHFAAMSQVGESMSMAVDYFDCNLGGTIALLAAMKVAGVKRLVFSSSAAVYGDPVRLPLDEDHPVAPKSPYGDTKLSMERLIGWAAGEGFTSCALRYFNAAGAWADGSLGEAHDPETHLLPLAIRAALGTAPPLRVFGDDWPTKDGTPIRDYVHVLDLADAHRRAVEHLLAGGAGGTWNLGSGEGYTVREVLDAVGRAVGRPVPHAVVGRRAGDPVALVASGARAAAELGWRPQRTLDDMVTSALAWERVRAWGPARQEAR